MNPADFVKHWHREARVAPPRFVPDSWLRQAATLMEKGITAEDLTLVAKWMLLQLARSQSGERNSVAFNAASFAWRKMFGEYGASDQHERFLELLAVAEAARVVPVAQSGTTAGSAAYEAKLAEAQARADRKLRAQS